MNTKITLKQKNATINAYLLNKMSLKSPNFGINAIKTGNGDWRQFSMKQVCLLIDEWNAERLWLCLWSVI